MKNITLKKSLAALAALSMLSSMGAITVFAHEGEDHSGSASTSVEVKAQSKGGPSLRDKLGEIKKEVSNIRRVQATTTASSSAEVELEHGKFVSHLKAESKLMLEKLRLNGKDFEARMRAWHQKMSSSTQELKVKLRANEKAHVEATLNMILTRFSTIADQMGTVSARLAANISALQTTKHYKLDESTKLLATADAKLVVAKDDIAKAKAVVSTNLNATTSKEELKSAISTAKESLKAAYDAYKDVIKEIRIEVRAQATTTSTTTAS